MADFEEYKVSLHNHIFEEQPYAEQYLTAIEKAFESKLNILAMTQHDGSNANDMFFENAEKILPEGYEVEKEEDCDYCIQVSYEGQSVYLLKANEVITIDGEALFFGNVGEVENRKVDGRWTSNDYDAEGQLNPAQGIEDVIKHNNLTDGDIGSIAVHPYEPKSGMAKYEPDNPGLLRKIARKIPGYENREGNVDKLVDLLEKGMIDTYEAYNAAWTMFWSDFNQRTDELKDRTDIVGITGNDGRAKHAGKSYTTVKMEEPEDFSDLVAHLKTAVRKSVENHEESLGYWYFATRLLDSDRI